MDRKLMKFTDIPTDNKQKVEKKLVLLIIDSSFCDHFVIDSHKVPALAVIDKTTRNKQLVIYLPLTGASQIELIVPS